MSRLPVRASGSRRAIRWAELLAAAQWAYERGRELWEALDHREREELRQLLTKSGGRPANLSRAEKRRVQRLVIKAFTSR